MDKKAETKEQKLDRLEQELQDLKQSLPEHCHGTQGFVSAHSASPAHWQKIEELEEQIKELKTEFGL